MPLDLAIGSRPRWERWVWSDEDFRHRVARICKELGRTVTSVLEDAGLAHDYLQPPRKTPKNGGRRINCVWDLANALSCHPGDLLGLPMMNEQIDRDLAVLAYQTARDAMQRVQNVDDENFVDTMLQIYNALLRRRSEGHDVRDPAYLKMIVDFLQDRPTTARRPT